MMAQGPPRGPSARARARMLDGAPTPLGASGRLPPGLAARFTLPSRQSSLSWRPRPCGGRTVGCPCRTSPAQVVGVAETTVRNAIREARKLGCLTVEERQITGFRNDTNIVRIVYGRVDGLAAPGTDPRPAIQTWIVRSRRCGSGGRVQIREPHAY